MRIGGLNLHWNIILSNLHSHKSLFGLLNILQSTVMPQFIDTRTVLMYTYNLELKTLLVALDVVLSSSCYNCQYL